MTFEEETQCNGYFGFGSGMNIMQNSTGYCKDCTIAEKCFEVHKERMSAIFPDLTGVYDKKLNELKEIDREHEIIDWWLHKHGGTFDPYITGVVANIEDGVMVREGGKPKDRGLSTLPYPFNEIN